MRADRRPSFSGDSRSSSWRGNTFGSGDAVGFLGFFLPHRTCCANAADRHLCKCGKTRFPEISEPQWLLKNLTPARPRIQLCRHMRAFASGARNSDPGSYLLSLPSFSIEETAHDRAAFFNAQQRELSSVTCTSSSHGLQRPPGTQASTIADLMSIRAAHGKLLRRVSLGTAVGFRTRDSKMTDTPAIIVFVSRKLNYQWVLPGQLLPKILQGPGNVWCDVDVVEFSYHGAPAAAPKEQVYSELVEALRGNDSQIGPGSQVASLEVYGTMGAIVRSIVGKRTVGFITNRHVAVDLDFPYQKLYHPLPPSLGPGIFMGTVDRATSFITDDLWYGMYAGYSPETFVRADGAFVPFASSFDPSCLTTTIKGVGELGDLLSVDLHAHIGCVVGKSVMKVGRSSGLTHGCIVAYGVEYHDEKGICFFTDLLVVGDNRTEFDMEGDSGSLIIMKGEDGEKPRPMGMIWGGTSNRGRLKLREGFEPENWTSGVDLGRLLHLLQVEMIPCDVALEDAWKEQHQSDTDSEAPHQYQGGESDVKDDSSRNPQTHASDVPGSSHQAARTRRGGDAPSGPEQEVAARWSETGEMTQTGLEEASAPEDVSLHLSLSPPKPKRTRFRALI